MLKKAMCRSADSYFILRTAGVSYLHHSHVRVREYLASLASAIYASREKGSLSYNKMRNNYDSVLSFDLFFPYKNPCTC